MQNEKLYQIYHEAMKITNETVPTTLDKDYFVQHEKKLLENFYNLTVLKCAKLIEEGNLKPEDNIKEYLIKQMAVSSKEELKSSPTKKFKKP